VIFHHCHWYRLISEHKALYSIAYADCFVLVSALRHNGIVVTGDPELIKVEHLAEVLWV